MLQYRNSMSQYRNSRLQYRHYFPTGKFLPKILVKVLIAKLLKKRKKLSLLASVQLNILQLMQIIRLYILIVISRRFQVPFKA